MVIFVSKWWLISYYVFRQRLADSCTIKKMIDCKKLYFSNVTVALNSAIIKNGDRIFFAGGRAIVIKKKSQYGKYHFSCPL